MQANHKMSLIKVVPYVVGMTPGVPGAPEPRMYPRSGYFLVLEKSIALQFLDDFFFKFDQCVLHGLEQLVGTKKGRTF